MTRTHLILLCLVLGVVAGIAIRWTGQAPLIDAANTAALGGQLWVRALQMTLIPLIFAMCTHSVASAVATGRGGRMIGTTLGLFLAAMVVTVILCTILTETVFRLGTVAHAVAAVLIAAHAAGIQPSLLQLVLAGLAVIFGSISGAGLPGAAVVYAIYGPGIQLLGAPMAIMPLYVAVIALPDPIITLSTVTGNLTVTSLVNRLLSGSKAVG